MLKRLGSRLDFLKGGARDLPARHQTLRQAIAWSYDLLNSEEQTLFHRLAVFVGGCSLEAAEAICNASGDLALDMLDGLAALVDKSLIRQDQTQATGDEPRFVMLETIREFAFERLRASEDWETTRRSHADFFVALAEKAESELTGPEHTLWLDTLARERDNLRAVFQWVEQTGEVQHGLRLGGALWRFWLVRGHLREGCDRLNALLTRPDAAKRSKDRAKALNGAGTILHNVSDYRAAHPLLKESLEIWREIGDKRGIATAINNLAWIACHLGHQALEKDDFVQANSCYVESLTLHQQPCNKLGIAGVLVGFGRMALAEGNQGRTARLFAAAERIHAAIGAPMSAGERARFDREGSVVRDRLGADDFAAAWAEGESMTMDQAIAYAFRDVNE